MYLGIFRSNDPKIWFLKQVAPNFQTIISVIKCYFLLVSGLGTRPTVVRQGGMQVAEAITSRPAGLMQRPLRAGDDLNIPGK